MQNDKTTLENILEFADSALYKAKELGRNRVCVIGENAKWANLALGLAAFAPACFPALIAANSFKSTMPKGWKLGVGIGALAAVALSVSGYAGEAVKVFMVVGASFGPICGAMTADYLLSGCKWNGPRAGFNLAGWISWAVGFAVGSYDIIAGIFD